METLLLLLSAIALLLLAVRVYGYFEGEQLIFDRIREVRLRRTTLASADAAFAANPRIADLVICLTTIPSRVELLDDTLKSLLLQKVRAREIRLHVPHLSRREGVTYRIPERIRQLAGVTLVACEDYGPATKLLPALRDLPAEQRILVVDDDRLYRDDMVAHVERFATAHPDVAFGFSGWEVPDDLTDRPSTVFTDIFTTPPVPHKSNRLRRPRRIDILQGYSGYAVKGAFFNVAEILDYSDAPDAAFFVDDVWTAAHCQVAKFVMPAPFSNFQSWREGQRFKRTSLGLLNRGGGDVNKRHNTIVLRHFPGRWLCGATATSPGTGD